MERRPECPRQRDTGIDAASPIARPLPSPCTRPRSAAQPTEPHISWGSSLAFTADSALLGGRRWLFSRGARGGLVLAVRFALLLLERPHTDGERVDFTARRPIEPFRPRLDQGCGFVAPLARRLDRLRERCPEALAMRHARIGFFGRIDPGIVQPVYC